MGVTMSNRSPNLLMLGIFASLGIFTTYGYALGLMSFLMFYAYTSL